MAKEIKITLIQSLIVNSVKNETYRRGQVFKAADEKRTAMAFHDQAGDDTYHEAIIGRAMFTQAEMLKTWFSEYLSGSGFLAEDPLISQDEENGTIEISLKVSDRFNNGYVKTLARLGQKYVEDRIIYLWWATTDKELAAIYSQLAEEDLVGIRRCFSKTAPNKPAYNFPTAIELRYPIIPERNQTPGYITPGNSAVIQPVQLFNNPWIIGRGEESEISYTLTGEGGKKPIDDVIVRCDDGCCEPFMHGGNWCLRGICKGITIVTLFSRHNDQVFAKFAIRIV